MELHGVARKDLDKIAQLKEFMARQQMGKQVGKPTPGVNTTQANVDRDAKMKHVLPPEIWELILHKIHDKKDLKNVSLVCRLFRNIVREQLWNCPKLKQGITVEDVERLVHLPINSLDTYDFGKVPGRGANVEKYMEVICSFPSLTALKLGGNISLSYSTIGKLVALKNLKSLILEKLYAGIAKAFSQLECLKLETLHIEDLIYNKDIDPIAKSVSKILPLKKLEIQTSDRGCLHLSKLPHLEELWIRESEISVVGLLELAKIKSLKKIKFCYCDDINTNIGPFKEANPGVKVEIEGEHDYEPYSDEDIDYDCDYDESDLPPDFFDTYSELHL